MKKIALPLAMLGLVWLAWPYFTAHNIARANNDGGTVAMETRISWPSLRQGFKDSLNALFVSLENVEQSDGRNPYGMVETAATAPMLSASEIDLFRSRLRRCWDVPVALRDIDKISVPVFIRFKIDGTLAATPEPESKSRDPQIQALTESAVRALIRCQPYTMFRRSNYEAWKELSVGFNPKDLFGGE